MKTRMGIGMAVAFLVLASVARAEPVPAEQRLNPQPVGISAAPCCLPGGHPCTHRHRLLEWLSYRPLTRPGLAGCCHQPACCRAPLYTWFLDYCQAGGGTAYVLRLPPSYPAGGCGCR